MSLGILVALPEELFSLTQQKIKIGECLTLPSKLLITLSGAGAHNAKQAAQRLLENGATQIISWGCAGGLSPTLKAGDLIIPELIQAQSNTLLKCDESLHNKLTKLLNGQVFFTGKLIESATIISSKEEKAHLFTINNALAVDMESAAAAQLAKTNNIPFIAIRTIVDPANFNLPKAVNHSLNAEGTINLSKLVLYICTHPHEIPALIKLGQHFKAANKKLAQIAPLLTQVSD